MLQRSSDQEDVACSSLFALIDQAELAMVDAAASNARQLRLQPLAAFVTRAGNGWGYVFAVLFALLVGSDHALRASATAMASLVVSFCFYPSLKQSLRRRRPCEYDRSLVLTLSPIDRYSFPSGHAMTAAAFAVPFVMFGSAACGALVTVGWLLVSWSRVALGHHYPSDIVAGSILGGVVALTFATLLS